MSRREDTIRALFERISARDFAGAVELLAEDVEFDLAYAPEMLEMPVRGRAPLQDLLTNVIGGMFEPFHIGPTAVYPGEGDVMTAEYQSEATVKHNGKQYVNRYVGVFRFRGDVIEFWREYHNTEAATQALS